jgi:ABC-2 type transport system ATP-binding protein
MGLADKADAYARTLSGGMRRRLLVAKAMVHNPPILVLDEPTAGVDIELRKQLWDYVLELHANGTTIVLTTHYLEEAQSLCDEIAIINHGEVVACEPTGKLLSRIEEKRLIIEPDTPLSALPAPLAALKAELREDGRLAVRYNPAEMKAGEILAQIGNAGVQVADVSTEEADLEDVFLQLTSSRS